MARKSLFLLLLIPFAGWSQTNSISSGNWTDISVWSTGVVPPGTATVNVNNPLVLDANITITTGTFNFFQSATDITGGTAYTLTSNTTGGVLDIKAGITKFEGAASFDNSTLFVRNGATLILGPTTINNQTNLTVETGGTLIINGDLTNNNNGIGTFTIGGLVQIYGNYSAPVGSVDVIGTGDLFTSGSITTTGSSNVFGFTDDCATGPCSGRNLCSFSNAINAAQTLCASGTPAGLTGNVVASATYIWESSTSSATTGYGLAAGTNNGQNYTPGSLTITTWYRRKVTLGGCTGTSPPIQISVLPASGGWKGVSNDWNTASNWCSNLVPTSTSDVSISAGVPNMPQMTAASFCRDLVINPGASVTINGSNSLSLSGNLVNNGTFALNTSTVSLVGTSQQTLSGNPVNFNNLTINNSSGASPEILINTFAGVLGTLTMTSGRVNLSGYNFTIGASAIAAGTLVYNAGWYYNGGVTRWLSVGTIADGDAKGLFPLGTVAYERPFFVSSPLVAITTGGTIRLNHDGAGTTSVVSFTDGSGNTVVRRQDSFWTLASANLVGGTYNLVAGGTGFGSVGNVNDLRLTRVSNVVGSNGVNSGTLTSPRVQRTSLSLASIPNNYYIGSVDASSSPLPITLLSFEGHYVADGVRLNWETATQENFDFFQIERSADGLNYLSIGKIQGEAYSTHNLVYSFLDNEPKFGKYYYRLKNIDRDGTFDYSKIINVSKDPLEWVTVYPNPTLLKDYFHVNLLSSQGEKHMAQLYDGIGRLVQNFDLNPGDNEIQFLENISPGVYFLKIASGLKQRTVKVLLR